MNFKDFVLLKENPDDIHGYAGSTTFMFVDNCIIYSEYTDSTHYEMLYALYFKIYGEFPPGMATYDMPGTTITSRNIRIIGTLPENTLKEFFDSGESADHTLYSRDRFIDNVPYSILGRLFPKKNFISFWNDAPDFNKANVETTFKFITLNKLEPKEMIYELGYRSERVPYDKFVTLAEDDSVPQTPRPSTDHIIHTIDPAKKGQVMKDMGIKPRAPLGAEKRFAMGEELSFKNFFTLKESPDRYFKDEWGDDYASWSNNDAVAFVVDYDFYALMYNHKHGDIFDQLKEWLVDDGHAMDIEFDGIPSKDLKNTLSRTTHRNRFLKRAPQIILGRLWYDQNIISFWNYRKDFTNDTVQQTIKMMDEHFGEASEYTYEIEEEKYSYDQFYNITSLNKIPEEPKQPMERPLHELPPELKGQVMKAQGIMPKKPVDIRQKYAYGESNKPLSFKLYLEATEKYIDKIKDAMEKVDERPFNELFGKNERLALKVYSPLFQKIIDTVPQLSNIEQMSNKEIGDVVRKKFNSLKKLKEKRLAELDESVEKYIKDNKSEILDFAKWLVDHDAYFRGDGTRLFIRINDGRYSVFTDSSSYQKDYKKISELIGLVSKGTTDDDDYITLTPEKALEFITTLIRNTKTYISSALLWTPGISQGNDFLNTLYSIVYEQYYEIRTQTADYRKIGKAKQAVDQHNIFNYLILSRHPVDVLRMSDHRGISSCHRLMGKYNEDGEGGYSHCAIADAQNSGGVVYLIKGAEYNSIKHNLNAPEIFEDIDRKVRGIRPTGRIRLRRFIDLETGDDFAVPTSSEYGGFTQEYYIKVLKYCQENQKITKNPPSAEYLVDNVVMVGGSYSDSSLRYMIDAFFNNTINWKKVDWRNDNGNRDIVHIDSHPKASKKKFVLATKPLGEIPYVDVNSITISDVDSRSGTLSFEIHIIINVGRQYTENVPGVYNPQELLDRTLPTTIRDILGISGNVEAKILQDTKLDVNIKYTKLFDYYHGLIPLGNLIQRVNALPSRLEARFD